MSKINILYSKHRVLNIPDLFKLLVAKFIYSVDDGELPKHFGNYFSDIASVHKYQPNLALLQKYHLPRIKISVDQLSLKYIGPFWCSWKFKISLAFFIWKTVGKRPAILPTIPLIFVLYTSHCKIDFSTHFSFYLYFSGYSFHSPVHQHPFPICFLFLLFCLLILFDFDSMQFDSFLLRIKRLRFKIDLCRQQGWRGNWHIWSFANPLWFK